jgi:hypothetical protein
MNRCILRFSGSGMSPAQVTEYLQGSAGISVLDTSSKMLLIEGAKSDIELATRNLEGWKVVPETSTPLPDTRKKLRK